jgi:hypothetical protein
MSRTRHHLGKLLARPLEHALNNRYIDIYYRCSNQLNAEVGLRNKNVIVWHPINCYQRDNPSKTIESVSVTREVVNGPHLSKQYGYEQNPSL